MLIVKKYMLFPALVITCAVSFVSAAENLKQHEDLLKKHEALLCELEQQIVLLEPKQETCRIASFRNEAPQTNLMVRRGAILAALADTNASRIAAARREAAEQEEHIQAVCDRFGIKDPKYRPLPRRRVTTGALIAHAV